MTPEEDSELVALLQESIRAANRTTRAVRGIVVPSTVLLVTALLAGLPSLVWLLGGGDGWVIISGMIFFIGLCVAIYAQINETRQSALPEESASWGIHGQGTLREEGGQGNLVALHCKCGTDERQDADTVSRFGVEYCNRCGLEVASP